MPGPGMRLHGLPAVHFADRGGVFRPPSAMTTQRIGHGSCKSKRNEKQMSEKHNRHNCLFGGNEDRTLNATACPPEKGTASNLSEVGLRKAVTTTSAGGTSTMRMCGCACVCCISGQV
ncbi:unnamed protein product [Protopolystoma xenopodis]|uniref:Uncharacterized protein n=1 Tax=Protopolystoma xenopodis TaxID=117903 RepID=A0A448WSE0_9PLAT|nr:unnamed protein product [Protopolystoma xenopodis]